MALSTEDVYFTPSHGGFELSAMVDGYRVHRFYSDYEPSEAFADFLAEYGN